MNSSKATVLSGIAFLVTSVGMGLVCANAHIDFFPCEKTVRDRAHADPTTGEAKLVTEAGTCSLMAHLREPMDGEKEELTGAGWALLVSFCMGIGMADAAILYAVLARQANK